MAAVGRVTSSGLDDATCSFYRLRNAPPTYTLYMSTTTPRNTLPTRPKRLLAHVKRCSETERLHSHGTRVDLWLNARRRRHQAKLEFLHVVKRKPISHVLPRKAETKNENKKRERWPKTVRIKPKMRKKGNSRPHANSASDSYSASPTAFASTP
jgi:hypothetical protein